MVDFVYSLSRYVSVMVLYVEEESVGGVFCSVIVVVCWWLFLYIVLEYRVVVM